MHLFREIMVWKRLNNTSAVRYCCLNNLETNKYAVQSADFFRLPLEVKSFTEFDMQFAELFIEVDAQERCNWFSSLEEAIKKHDEEFSQPA